MNGRFFVVCLLIFTSALGCGGEGDVGAGRTDTTDQSNSGRSGLTDTTQDSAREREDLGGGTSPEDAVAVVRRYYTAIDNKDYRRAYDAWQGNGKASDQTFEAFKAGFAETDSVTVEIGEPGRVEPAAGSRYIEVPVTVKATTTRGTAQRFTGHYVLRRSVVEGASDDQRRWHLYSADLVEGTPDAP